VHVAALWHLCGTSWYFDGQIHPRWDEPERFRRRGGLLPNAAGEQLADIYFDEFDNTYSDGREILTKIRVESGVDSEGALNFNRFIHGDGATQEFPRGVIYHINPVTPPKRKY
jgi:hypothetical protein